MSTSSALLARLNRIKKLSSLLTCPFPKTSDYYWNWNKKIFSTKAHVLAVIDYIQDNPDCCKTKQDKNGKIYTPFAMILNKMFLETMDSKYVEVKVTKKKKKKYDKRVVW
eukprot:273128_1